jgi:hypothetical protein
MKKLLIYGLFSAGLIFNSTAGAMSTCACGSYWQWSQSATNTYVCNGGGGVNGAGAGLTCTPYSTSPSQPDTDCKACQEYLIVVLSPIPLLLVDIYALNSFYNSALNSASLCYYLHPNNWLNPLPQQYMTKNQSYVCAINPPYLTAISIGPFSYGNLNPCPNVPASTPISLEVCGKCVYNYGYQ